MIKAVTATFSRRHRCSLVTLASLLVVMGLFPIDLSADELRPAYVELNESDPGLWQVYFKTSWPSQLAREGSLDLPTSCEWVDALSKDRTSTIQVQKGRIQCELPLEGQTIGILGLSSSQTDALLRIQPLDSPLMVLRLTPDQARAAMPTINEGEYAGQSVFQTYTWIGVEHILWGYDHLLFVVALVLLLQGLGRTIGAVTAFTVAHSVTLIGTTLGWMSLPSKPVEAVIALSIVFLASEVVKQTPSQPRLSERSPWMVAFAFGLLHGFGFAGALAEIGLPESDVPLALLSFNLGVELGQIAVVIGVMAALAMLRTLSWVDLTRVKSVLAYAIGAIATFWLIERL